MMFCNWNNAVFLQRKKGFWNFTSTNFTKYYKDLFQEMEDDSILDR